MDWNNKQMVLEAVKQRGRVLQFASDKLKNNKEVVLQAVKQDGYAFRYASKRLQNDKNVVLDAVNKNGGALKWVSYELKNDKEVIIEAVKQNGMALLFAFDDLRNDKDVLNSMRDFLMSDSWVGDLSNGFFFKVKENLLQYDREDREKELLSKLADLDKLQAQQQNSINQPKVEVKSRRKV